MAWTNPKTWSVGETLTAANFNTHIRDNLLAVGEHLIVRKTADESDSTATHQNDDVLLVAVAANEIWQFRFNLLVVAATTTDFKCRLTFPTGGNLSCITTGRAGAVPEGADISSSISPSTESSHNTAGSVSNHVIVEGVYVNGGTAGNLQLQWSGQAAASCTVKANSTLWAVKLA